MTPLPVSWKRPLAALWAMQFLAMIGMSQFLPLLPLYVQSLGVEDPALAASWSGVLVGVGFLFSGLMAPVWGAVADRWGRKRMVLRAMLGSSLALLGMAYAGSVHHLLFLRMVHGSLGGFVSAATALAAGLVPEARIGLALGALQSAAMAGIIVGPVLGGFVSDRVGFRPMILLSAGLLVASAAVVAALVPADRAEEAWPGWRAVRSGVLENVRFVRDSPALVSAAGVQFIVQAALMAVQPVIALLVQSLSAEGVPTGSRTGLVFSVTGAATFVGSFVLGRHGDRGGHVSVLQNCLLGAAIVYLPQAFASSLLVLVLLRAALGFFVGGIYPSTQSLIAKETPAEKRAGVLGVTFTGSLFGNAVGPMVGGALAAVAGVRAPFLFTAGLLFLAWGVCRRTMVRESDPAAVTEEAPV